MAVITCKECGKTISGKAKICPYCHKVQRTGLSTWKVIVIFVFIFIVAVYYADRRDQAPVVQKSPDELRKERIENQFSGWNGSHYGLTKLIKNAMNDPKSYEHAETVYVDKGDHLKVKTTYRGKNAFGGIVKNWVWAKVDLEGNVIEVIAQGP